MSYILDALRRADSERERGSVPSLHAKQVPADLADEDDGVAGRRPQPLLWAVSALALALAVLLLWQFMFRDAPEPAPAMPPANAPVAMGPAPVIAPPVTPAVVQPPPPAAPPPMPAAVAVPVNPPPARASTTVRKPASGAAAQAEAPPASAATEKPAIAFAQLPDDIRRELPQLVIGGAMYSKTPANRMLILNGQVFHEGDKVAPGLVLEQIQLKSAVLSYRSYRYLINY